MCVFEWRCPVKRQRNSSMSESKAEWCRLASDGSEAVDWLSTNRSSGVVAGQHELGQALDHVAQSGAVHVRVALDGYGRKVAVCSGGWREELVKVGLMMELSVLYNFLLLIFIARLLVHSHRGHHFGLQSIGSYLTFLIFFQIYHSCNAVTQPLIVTDIAKKGRGKRQRPLLGKRQRQDLPLPIVSQWATKLAAKSCSKHSVTKNGCHHRCRV